MSVTDTDYGSNAANTLAKDGTLALSPSAFSVALWTANEIDLTVTNSFGNHLIKIAGSFNLASLSTTPTTLADFINDSSLGTVSSLTNFVNGTTAPTGQGFTEAFGTPVNFPDLVSLLGFNGTSAQSVAYNTVYSGNDSYYTSNDATGIYSDAVDLYGGNNTFYENHPKLQYVDVFYGGWGSSNPGINTAVLPGKFADYSIAQSSIYDAYTGHSDLSGGYMITDNTGATNTLQVYQVQRLQFAGDNTKIALDVGNGGHAGETAEILGAVFGAASIQAHPDYVGIGLQLLDGGMSFSQLSALALNVAGATTPQAVVNLLWTNLFGSAPTSAQAAPFVQMLTSNAISTGDLAVMAENLSLNTTNINLVGLQQTGIHYV